MSSLLLAVILSQAPEMPTWVQEVQSEARLPGLAVAVLPPEGDPRFFSSGVDADGAPVTEHTVFAIGSLSKSFTAFAVMLLVERGALSIDAPASKWIPELDERITVRHLLHQTSGFSGSEGFWLKGGTLAHRVAALKDVSLRFEPGRAHQYSNANYDALGLVVERVSKKPFATFLRDEVLAPLKLDEVWSASEKPSWPDGHQDWFGLISVRRAADEWNTANTPSGGLFATAHGLAGWLRVHRDAKQLLSPKGYKALHTVGTDETSSYAMGWTKRTLNNQPMLVHSGQTGEFTSTMVLLPKTGLATLALANVNAFASPVTRLAVRDLAPAAASIALGQAPVISSQFGLRNQQVFKLLFFAITLLSVWRVVAFLRRQAPRPKKYAVLDLAMAVAMVVLVPIAAQITWPGLIRFTPDLAVVLMVGAAGAVIRAVLTLQRKPEPEDEDD